MSARPEDAEIVATIGPSSTSGGEGPFGVVAYTILTDAGKATAVAQHGGGEPLVVQARLATLDVPASRDATFKFAIAPEVIAAVKAWREKLDARPDYFLWISHAGAGFISAAEGQAVGPIEISRMDLVPPALAQDASGADRTRHNLAMKKLHEERAKLGKRAEGSALRTIGKGTPHGEALRSYVRLDSLAELIAACHPWVIHIASCSFGKKGVKDVPGLRAVNGPEALALLVAQRLGGFSGVMTYSCVDTGLSADNPHIRPGDPGCDTNRLLIKEGVANEGSPEAAREFLATLRGK